MVLGFLGMVSGGAGAQTSLYWALANNDAAEVWRLTEKSIPPGLDENGFTAPEWAVARGNAEALEALLWRGASLDGVDDEGKNLLFGAAALGRLDLFETIQAHGARVDQVDAGGFTLVHMAAQSPHPEMLQTLLSFGLDPRTKSSVGVTPLMVASRAGRSDEVATLLRWGAVAEDQDFLGRSVRDYAVASDDPNTLAAIDQALTPWTIEPADGAPLP